MLALRTAGAAAVRRTSAAVLRHTPGPAASEASRARLRRATTAESAHGGAGGPATRSLATTPAAKSAAHPPLLDLIETRHCTHSFDPARPVPREMIEAILRAASQTQTQKATTPDPLVCVEGRRGWGVCVGWWGVTIVRACSPRPPSHAACGRSLLLLLMLRRRLGTRRRPTTRSRGR